MRTRKARNKLHKSEFEYENGVKVYAVDFGTAADVYPERRENQFDVFIERNGEIEDEVNLTVEADLDEYELEYESNNGVLTVQLTPVDLVSEEPDEDGENQDTDNADGR